MLLDPITIKVIVSKSKVRLEKLVGAVSHQGERGKQPGENSECPGPGSTGSSEGAAARRRWERRTGPASHGAGGRAVLCQRPQNNQFNV